MVGRGEAILVCDVLAAHYTPRAAAELSGLGAIKGDPAVAVLTGAVQRATLAWMAERCELDLTFEELAHLEEEFKKLRARATPAKPPES